eukprot:TRINITY_DN187_c0_g1_i6.p1 TRINITY_DN187_c0_g1~~TRINITY_DN187_c0_g1_i6.p1  ORF type:complete len:247 (+),score=69.99 TRINITY_DN187_c0_g1_i6:238-978(+)
MVFLYFFFFFFQAEDGIRDLVRSRGLGDVYKRQVYGRRITITVLTPAPQKDGAGASISYAVRVLSIWCAVRTRDPEWWYAHPLAHHPPSPQQFRHATMPCPAASYPQLSPQGLLLGNLLGGNLLGGLLGGGLLSGNLLGDLLGSGLLGGGLLGSLGGLLGGGLLSSLGGLLGSGLLSGLLGGNLLPVLCVDTCLLYTSDAADDLLCVDLGGRRIIKKKKRENSGCDGKKQEIRKQKNVGGRREIKK